MDNHSQEKDDTLIQEGKEQKPWEFKKQENGKWKAFTRGTDNLLEGFEELEWDYPLVGGRFIAGILKAADDAASQAAGGLIIAADLFKKRFEQVGDVPKTKIDVSGVDASDAEAVARKIDLSLTDERLQAQDEHQVLTRLDLKRMFRIVIPKQTNSDQNKPVFVPNHEGGKDFLLKRGVEYTVPEYVVNILKESIATQTSYDFETNAQGVRAIPTVERIPRFSLNILGEIKL